MSGRPLGSSVAAWGGFDTRIVARLTEPHALIFGVIGIATVGSSALLGFGAYILGAMSVADSPAVAWLVGLFMAFLALNVTRLVHSGTGYALHLPREALERWRPSLTSVLLNLLWAAVLSQPVIAWLDDAKVAEEVTTTRDDLVDLQSGLTQLSAQAEQQELDADAARAEAMPESTMKREAQAAVKLRRAQMDERARQFETGARTTYAQGLAHAPMLARRLQLVWQTPWSAFLLTLLFALLGAAAPLLRFAAANAARAYERERYTKERSDVELAWQRGTALVESTLSGKYPRTFRRPLFCGFEDPPFNTMPRRPPYLAGSLRTGAGDDLFAEFDAMPISAGGSTPRA